MLQGEVQLAQASPAPDPPAGGVGDGPSFILLMIAMGLLMYALLIRPQQRQQKEHKKMLSQIKKGDQVVTSGGVHGRVTGVTDEVLTVEIADRVRIKVSKSAISSRVTPGEGDRS